MTRILITLGTLALLGACGADGRPTAPEETPQAGVTLTGSVEVGIVGGSRAP